MNDTLNNLLNAIMAHLPTEAAWGAVGGIVAGVFGLVLLTKGAKLAPWMTALALAATGVACGLPLANAVGTPQWPTAAVTGIVSGILGLALFRFWLAGMVGAGFVLTALSFYGGTVLRPHIESYASEQGVPRFTGTVSLPSPAEIETVNAQSAADQFGLLWSYLGQNVSNFQAAFFAIVISSGIAGIVFGLLVPRLSRSLWASSLGVVLFTGGLAFTLQLLAPAALTWLASLGGWTWALFAGVWAASLIYNLVDSRPPRTAKTGDEDGGQAALATA